MKLLNLFRKRAIVFSAALVLLLIILNTAFVYFNDLVLEETKLIKTDAERAKYQVSQLWNQVVRNVDIGLRGFALTKQESLLGPVNDGVRDFPIIVKDIKEITARQGFTDKVAIDSMAIAVNGFVESSLAMVEIIKMDSMDLFRRELKKDPGRDAWLAYSKYSSKINDFEDAIINKATLDYEKANTRTIIIQTLLIIIGAPTLLFMMFRISRDEKSRLNLFLKLEKNNRKYLFDSGLPLDIKNEDEVIDNSIKTFEKATKFISSVSAGDFNIHWEEYNKENEALNQNNLSGELIRMRDKMKTIKAEEEIRNWINEGLASFSDIIRKNQSDMESLSNNIIGFVCKYLNAQQGAIFILRDGDNEVFLELTACFAFDKKKFIEKRIEPGEGLVGQTFLEGMTNFYKKVPDGYTYITSGLGESTPSCLLLVPIKYNESVEGVIEIASFEKYEKYQIEFLEKIGEITGSTMGSVKNTEKIQILLDQFKTQAEQLKAQEEILRQNMEEMEATQEALRRQEREIS